MELGGWWCIGLIKLLFQSQEPILYASLLRSCKGFPPFPRFDFHQNSERHSVDASVREGTV